MRGSPVRSLRTDDDHVLALAGSHVQRPVLEAIFDMLSHPFSI